MNALKPETMSSEERLAEIGRILARGLIRLHAGKSRPLSVDGGDSCLDFLPDQRRHADTLISGKA